MNEDKNKISNWLENLQRESWQMELLISGFTIFLLLQASAFFYPLIDDLNLHTDFSNDVRGIIVIFIFVIQIAIYILIINLVLHISLRGFWIAAIGLRSVQQETDFENLNYSTFFTQKLKEKVRPLDELIQRLDTICSVVFAFAFLVVFMLLSFVIWITFVIGIQMIVGYLETFLVEDGILYKILNFFWAVFIIFTLITGLIYFLDTLTLGFFKRYKWISKIYYPIYKFQGWITFSSIYRGIYYNLISRFPKNNIRLFLSTFILLGVLLPFQRITFYKYFPDHNSDAKEIGKNNYDDTRNEDDKIWGASIPSEIISNKYLPLFIRYNVKHNEVLDSLCTDYAPTKQSIFISGLRRDGFRDPYYPEDDPDKLLECLSSLYLVNINDSLYSDIEYYFYRHPNQEELGLRTMIPTHDLPRGKNVIHLQRKAIDKDKKFSEKTITKIPFWLE